MQADCHNPLSLAFSNGNSETENSFYFENYADFYLRRYQLQSLVSSRLYYDFFIL